MAITLESGDVLILPRALKEMEMSGSVDDIHENLKSYQTIFFPFYVEVETEEENSDMQEILNQKEHRIIWAFICVSISSEAVIHTQVFDPSYSISLETIQRYLGILETLFIIKEIEVKTEFSVNLIQNLPESIINCETGIYVIKFMEKIIKIEELCLLKVEEIQELREKMFENMKNLVLPEEIQNTTFTTE